MNGNEKHRCNKKYEEIWDKRIYFEIYLMKIRNITQMIMVINT